MQVSVEKTSELNRKMTVSIPEAVLQEKMETRFKKLAREVKVDGFRPGKVPVSIVKKMFGDRVKGEVTGDLIQSSYFDALEQQALMPAGQPRIMPSEKSDGFEYVAEFEVYPEISLDNVNGLDLVRPLASVQDTDVENMIAKLREQKKTWHVLERVTQEGDRVTIHFSGMSEGENFTDGKVENFAVEIGGKQMIPGFEDELKGLSVGDQKTFSITFPVDYSSEKLAGKLAEFQIEIVKVEEPRLPEIDADFIKAYGIDEGDAASFRDDVRTNMARELVQGLKIKFKNTVLDALYEHASIDIPNALVDQEIQTLMKPYAERAKSMRLKLEDLNLPSSMFEDQAKRRVALGLILGEIIQKNEIRVDEEKVRSVIEDMSKSYEKPEDVLAWYYADKSRLNDVQQMVLEDQAIDWVVERAKVSEQNFAFDEVMEKRQA